MKEEIERITGMHVKDNARNIDMKDLLETLRHEQCTKHGSDARGDSGTER